jgi:hypothetical protein
MNDIDNKFIEDSMESMDIVLRYLTDIKNKSEKEEQLIVKIFDILLRYEDYLRDKI